MKVGRRNATKVSALGAAARALPLTRPAYAHNGGSGGTSSAGRPPASRLPRPFTVPLVQPPIPQPVRQGATTDFYQLIQQPANAEIIPGPLTTVRGYNGVVLRPTIQAMRDRETVVRQINALPQVHPVLG